ncbi:MAG: sigma 54-interacting transcriptional regulator [Sporomusaceae bacterium]|nr:sigma 54-interacting transcriptional regulator [Sporomusaceae bacterium]
MPSIGVVTKSRQFSLGTFLRDNLREVLGDTVKIHNYYVDELQSGQWILDDVVLTMSSSNQADTYPFVRDKQKVSVVRRTIQARDVYRLFAIPPHTEVLVVNDHAETTRQTVALLYQLNVKHLDFIPYDPGQNYEQIHFAVTPGESHLVPNYIAEIIDFGNRLIDTSTFIDIFDRLLISDPEVTRRLLAYAEGIVALDNGVNKRFRDLFVKNTELDTVINLSHEGILVVNKQREITLSNQALLRILDFPQDLAGRDLAAVFDGELFTLLCRDSQADQVTSYRGKSLVITRKAMKYCGEVIGVCYVFQEITHIKRLEETLGRQLSKKGLTAKYCFTDIFTHSPAMQECIARARKFAASDLTVLITGDTGTGKELLAQSIHQASQRAKYPFLAINCAAVPENLLESELFGYVGGAFTGAMKEGKAGLFEQANNGTIFLDEIGDMPYALQVRLLRVLQEKQVMRLGSSKVLDINVRIIAATNQELSQHIQDRQFRKDLYYRLNVLPLKVPALYERKEDILPLLTYFLAEEHQQNKSFDNACSEVLLAYSWPGNIRELQNTAAFLTFAAGNVITLADLPHHIMDQLYEFTAEYDTLSTKCSWPKVVALLKGFEAVDRQKGGVGRGRLAAWLAQNSAGVSETEIRQILLWLNRLGIARSGVGRSGTSLTAKGDLFVNWLKNRLKKQPV